MNSSLISAQGRLHLVRPSHNPEALGDLEMELTNWIPGEDSPDRMDALVHGINYCEDSGSTALDERFRQQMAERRQRNREQRAW